MATEENGIAHHWEGRLRRAQLAEEPRRLVVAHLGPVPYLEALALQRRLVELRAQAAIPDVLILCQHPPVVTLGRGADAGHVGSLVRAHGIPVVAVERGGDVTYHGPGQLVGYPILALEGPARDLHAFLRGLEAGLIAALGASGLASERVSGLTGVWVGGAKVAAIGIAVRRWVTYHGFALNVNVDLRPFEWIVPCGLHGRAVTSMQRLLGAPLALDAVAAEVARQLGEVWKHGSMEVWK